MSARKRELPIRLLRRVLLVALLALVLAVLAIYLVGRVRRSAPRTAAESRVEQTEGNLILAGEGFDYELTQEGRVVFHIHAERILSDRENSFALEQVGLVMTRPDGDEFRISSDEGTYDIDSQEASLRGHVQFQGPSAIELESQGLELRRRGRVLVSSSPVVFRFLERFVGRADRMRADARRNVFVLAGRIAINSLPGSVEPLTLSCQRFAYDRDERRVRAEGDVVLTRGDDVVRARRLTLTLDDEEKSVRFVRASWDVGGRLQTASSEGPASFLDIQGQILSAVMDPETRQPVKVEVEGDRNQSALLAVSDETGLGRNIRSPYMVGDFRQGELARLTAFDGVEVTEVITFAPESVLSSACGETAEATFEAGELVEVLLTDNVDILEQGVLAHGSRARADQRAGRVELEGEPAWILSSRGRIAAPKIVYLQDEGRIEAGEQVRAEVTGESGLGLGARPGDAAGPIQVESVRAEWSEAESKIRFLDKVRAWQGENFLIARELEGDTSSSVMTAIGSVRTVWSQPPVEGEGAEGEAAAGEPIEVTAARMEYDRSRRLLTYSQGARVTQAKRTLSCTDIELRQDEEGGFDQLLCTGVVRIDDGETGNTVSGERAIYQPREKRARVYGSPVVLRDSKGTEISGRLLVYDFTAGTAQIQALPPEEEGEPDEPAADAGASGGGA